MTTSAAPVGQLFRQWRERRRRSQLDVAIAAEVSARHLSFVETGRSMPSRAMIERLADELDIPLRDRNTLYLAAGYAPVHEERPVHCLGAARDAVEAVLAGHEPNPALVVNVRWELLAANRAARTLLAAGGDHPAGEPPNVLRLALHPSGLAPQIRNYEQWRRHVVRRIRRQLDRTGAPGLAELLAEIESYPAPEGADLEVPGHGDDLVVPLRLRTPAGDLALLYTVTVFGGPQDVTLDEIAVETFFPADAATADVLRAAAGDA